MREWSRLARYVKPHWRTLAFAIGFGGAVALLWSGALLLTYPVIKVFLEGKHLGSFISHEIETSTEKLDEARSKLNLLLIENGQEATIPAAPAVGELASAGQSAAKERAVSVPLPLKVVREQARLQKEIDTWARKLYLMTWLESRVVPWLPVDQFRLLLGLLVILLAATVLKGAATVVQDMLVGRVAELTVMHLRKDLHRHLLKSDPLEVAITGTPRYMATFMSDTQQLTQGLMLAGGEVIREPLKAVACLSAALMLNFRLTCVLLIFVPLAGGMFYLLSRRLKRAMHKTLDAMTRIYQQLEETFSLSKVVIAFGTQRDHRARFRKENREYYRKALQIVRIDALSSPVAELLGIGAVMAVLIPAGYLVLEGQTSIGPIQFTETPMNFTDLALLYTLMAGTLDPVRKFSRYVLRIRQTGTSAERIFKALDKQPTIVSPAAPVPFPRHSETIRFENITFGYPQAEGESRKPVLTNLDLTIHAGEAVAIVGTNGSGKSTLVNLLPRFADPQEGRILIDGIDLKDLRLRDLRAQIGIVSQDIVLFDDTIAGNILSGVAGHRSSVTAAEMEAAAGRSSVLEFAKDLPQGLETSLGSGGRQLSGGQRQRIALARAMLRDPAILILDEPTSAIDAHSEQAIQRALKEFTRGRTTLLITHAMSPSLLTFITRIVVLDQGRLIADGTHHELLATCPIYQRLFHAEPRRVAA